MLELPPNLGIIFVREGEAARWLRSPNQGIVFGGQSPMDLITSGDQDALRSVRRHLDAWRGGIFHAATAADISERTRQPHPHANCDVSWSASRRAA
jgi:hypothetical protein